MSWSIVAGPASAADFAAVLDDTPVHGPEGSLEMDAQIAEAKDTAKRWVASGKAGAGPMFGCSLAGHANPDFAAPCSVSVQVYSMLAS